MTKVTDELTAANNASSIFNSNKRLKEFFTLIPSHRRDEDAIICKSFFSTEFILNLSNATGLAYSQIQNIHKCLLLDDNGVYLWAMVETLLTDEERKEREEAEEAKKNKDKSEKEKKEEEKAAKEKKEEEEKAAKENKTEEEEEEEDKKAEKDKKKEDKKKEEEIVFPIDDKVYLMSLNSFKGFSEFDYCAERAND